MIKKYYIKTAFYQINGLKSVIYKYNRIQMLCYVYSLAFFMKKISFSFIGFINKINVYRYLSNISVDVSYKYTHGKVRNDLYC